MIRIRESGKSTYYSKSDKIKILDPRISIFKLKIEVDGNGSTNPEPNEYLCQEDEEIKISAVADEGWIFERWIGDVESQEVEVKVTCGEKDKIIVAKFIVKEETKEAEESNEEEEN